MAANSENEKQPHSGKSICGATAKSTGKPCELPAGFGTDHVGKGRCKYHGGKNSGAPKKNKNSVKTGEYETLWYDTLDDNEKQKLEEMTTSILEQLDHEIKLTNIRIGRMMGRIENLKDKKEIVSRTTEQTFINGDGEEAGGNITEEKENTLDKINNIEEALTRVQRRKEKLLRLKYDIEEGTDDDEKKLEAVVEAMNQVASD